MKTVKAIKYKSNKNKGLSEGLKYWKQFAKKTDSNIFSGLQNSLLN